MLKGWLCCQSSWTDFHVLLIAFLKAELSRSRLLWYALQSGAGLPDTLDHARKLFQLCLPHRHMLLANMHGRLHVERRLPLRKDLTLI